MRTLRNPSFRQLVAWYSNLVIAPRLKSHLSREALDAQRLYAAQCVIRKSLTMRAPRPGYNRLAICFDLAEFTKAAPRDLPFKLTHLDAFRMAVDELHTLNRQGVAA